MNDQNNMTSDIADVTAIENEANWAAFWSDCALEVRMRLNDLLFVCSGLFMAGLLWGALNYSTNRSPDPVVYGAAFAALLAGVVLRSAIFYISRALPPFPHGYGDACSRRLKAMDAEQR